MKAIKPIAFAFIVGGIFSVLGQGLIVMFASILGEDSVFVVPLTLVGIGLIGGALFVAGIYQKIEKIGAYGAILPFCGFAAAVAGVFTRTKAETGSQNTALKAALGLVGYVLGIGTILTVIIGIAAFLTM